MQDGARRLQPGHHDGAVCRPAPCETARRHHRLLRHAGGARDARRGDQVAAAGPVAARRQRRDDPAGDDRTRRPRAGPEWRQDHHAHRAGRRPRHRPDRTRPRRALPARGLQAADAPTVKIDGTATRGFERIAEAFERNFGERGEVGASVCVTVDGKTVVDLWGGLADPKAGAPWKKDTVSIVFSCTKGATALCAHMLASRGKLDLDAPVTELWPEFGQNGKERVTTRMMLDHSAGVPALRDKVKDSGPYEWDYMTGRLAAEAPFWEPGTRNGYHGLTFGWTVGEMVRRASGKSLGTFFQDEVAKPLGLDFWIGLPEAIEPRVAPMTAFVNRPEQAITPFLRALTTDK